MSSFIVGAYAASPCSKEWNPSLEADYYRGLRGLGQIAGLEIPFHGELHPHDSDGFLSNIDPKWNFVLTCIPGTMEQLQTHREFGLASDSLAGRNAALEFAEKARKAALQLNAHLGRNAVLGIEIHSAPQLGHPEVSSSKKSFLESLRELGLRDWGGAALLVEHCDRYTPEREPAKGFLRIEDELEAIAHARAEVSTPIGMLVNWGRSALEERDPSTPLKHIRAAREAGLLMGLMFSGVTATDTLYGSWKDSHAPFALDDGITHFSNGSLMTLERARACAQEANWQKLRCFGFKIQALPRDMSIEGRLGLLRDSLGIMMKL